MAPGTPSEPSARALPSAAGDAEPPAILWLAGDVMTGRGLDQVLPWPCDPVLYEPFMRSAEGYVELAERAGGAIRRPVDPAHPWGEALGELARVRPHARIANLETALTRSPDAWPGKGIHYRTSPENARTLRAAGIDVCALANNHVLDWGHAGLEETRATLGALGIAHAGAGRTRDEAEAPAAVDLRGRGAAGRVLVFSFATEASGVPAAWAATRRRPGVALLPGLSPAVARRLGELVRAHRREGDVVVLSLHHGGNWGYTIPREERAFAHALVGRAGVDVLHGHSSHHVKGIEVHRGRLLLYGCGDFLNDYEGIRGHEAFRGDLGLMLFAHLAPGGALRALRMTPTRIRRLRIERAPPEDAAWLAACLAREGAPLGTGVRQEEDGRLALRWEDAPR